MDTKNIQIGMVNVVIGGAMLWFLIVQRSLNLDTVFFWLATGTFIIHWYWGLVAYVRYVGPTEELGEFCLDIIAVGMQVSTIFWINTPVIWFILNGLSFSLAIAKYLLSLKTRKLPHRVVEYIKEKTKLHSLGVVGMFAGAIAAIYFQPQWLLGLITLVVHILAMYYLIIRKVYVLHEAGREEKEESF